MYAQKMQSNCETAYLVSRFFYLPHIYDILCDALKDCYGVHRLLQRIEDGSVWVFGAFSKENNLLAGVCYGEMVDGYFVTHLLFCRKTNAFKAVGLCFEELKKYCRENNITLYGAKGFVPVSFKAPVDFAFRFGAQDYGIVQDAGFIKDGKNIPCHEFIKGV
jgi:hypothetical protein